MERQKQLSGADRYNWSQSMV